MGIPSCSAPTRLRLRAIAALALSQYVVHPALTVVLSDRKLDVAVQAVSGLADRLTRLARAVM